MGERRKRTQRSVSLFQHQMQRSGDWGWLQQQQRKIIYNVSFEAGKVCRVLNFARLSENQRCVANRSDDTQSPSLHSTIEMFAAGRTKNRRLQEENCPLLVTALTALIINGFFIRNCRSLRLPRDLNRFPKKKNRFSS